MLRFGALAVAFAALLRRKPSPSLCPSQMLAVGRLAFSQLSGAFGTGSWTKRFSYGLDARRGGPTVWFNSQWLVGDSQSTKLLKIDATNHFEDNRPIQSMVESGPIFGVSANTVVLLFAMGVGSARAGEKRAPSCGEFKPLAAGVPVLLDR